MERVEGVVYGGHFDVSGHFCQVLLIDSRWYDSYDQMLLYFLLYHRA